MFFVCCYLPQNKPLDVTEHSSRKHLQYMYLSRFSLQIYYNYPTHVLRINITLVTHPYKGNGRNDVT